MRTRIKFCGMTRVEDAEAAVNLGADAIGLVLAQGSPRFISLAQAAIIRRRLPESVQAVALFRNADAQEVVQAVNAFAPDLLQFHGEESPEFCVEFGVPYWRAVPMAQPQDLLDWSRRFATANALLLDAHTKGERGGLGKTFNWSGIRRASTIPLARKLVLAGGLTPDNVAVAVQTVRPYAVDVSSGIESSPGIKDQAKMRKFIEEVRRADGH